MLDLAEIMGGEESSELKTVNFMIESSLFTHFFMGDGSIKLLNTDSLQSLKVDPNQAFSSMPVLKD